MKLPATTLYGIQTYKNPFSVTPSFPIQDQDLGDYFEILLNVWKRGQANTATLPNDFSENDKKNFKNWTQEILKKIGAAGQSINHYAETMKAFIDVKPEIKEIDVQESSSYYEVYDHKFYYYNDISHPAYSINRQLAFQQASRFADTTYQNNLVALKSLIDQAAYEAKREILTHSK